MISEIKTEKKTQEKTPKKAKVKKQKILVLLRKHPVGCEAEVNKSAAGQSVLKNACGDVLTGDIIQLNLFDILVKNL